MGLFEMIMGDLLLALLLLGILWHLLLPTLLRSRGVVVKGYVFERGTQFGRFRSIYYLSYSYDYHGKTYTHRQGTNEDAYHIWSEGGDAQVRCLPMLPFIARLEV